MGKIEVPNAQELERRFNKALATLPEYYRIIYPDFKKFMSQSLELAVKFLEDVAERDRKAIEQQKAYAS